MSDTNTLDLNAQDHKMLQLHAILQVLPSFLEWAEKTPALHPRSSCCKMQSWA